jgi:hypothetical protein
MTCSTARLIEGRKRLKLILSESHGAPRGTGDAPKAMVARSTSDRTAANSEERWPIGAGMAFCMGTGALAYVAMFWVLFG